MSCRYTNAYNESESLIAKTKHRILREAAEAWLEINPGKDPKFSGYGEMIFDENEAAEEIGEAIISAGEKFGFGVISPYEIVAAVLMAKQLRRQANGGKP